MILKVFGRVSLAQFWLKCKAKFATKSELNDHINKLVTDTTYANFVKSGTGAKAGLVPAPSTTAGSTKYLREDGIWAQVTKDKIGNLNIVSSSKDGLMPSALYGSVQILKNTKDLFIVREVTLGSITLQPNSSGGTNTTLPDIAEYTPILVTPKASGSWHVNFASIYKDDTKVYAALKNTNATQSQTVTATVNILYVRTSC